MTNELVRARRTDTELSIEIAGTPLRRYLAVRSRLLVVQHDGIHRLDHVPEPTIDAVDSSDTRHFSFHSGDIRASEHPGFVRLVGKQIVLPIDAAPVDLARSYSSERRFPAFTVAIDPGTGERITSTCDPAKLSTHAIDRGTPHYLTRVYFRRDVLKRYTSQPSRYRMENDRLSCLGLWGISIGTNPDGFIEVYLGDLGRDLPTEERDHWLSFNVPPSGGRDEARHDRDILGRWADGPPDPLSRLFAARQHFSATLRLPLPGTGSGWCPQGGINRSVRKHACVLAGRGRTDCRSGLLLCLCAVRATSGDEKLYGCTSRQGSGSWCGSHHRWS
ncbi:hypothetical protein [Streptomyces sp. NPDC101178]|uniref:hypothetical protein n=1 Tax=Streptomyces sp. NPDC101178 TaxID=3366124 RepID=UPI0037F483D8